MAENYIKNLTAKINDSEIGSYEKANYIHSLIQIKNKSDKFKVEIYNDSKEFIRHYVEGIETRSFGYDTLDIGKIHEIISTNKQIEEKLNLYHYTYRILKRFHFDNESTIIKERINSLKFQLLKFKKSYTRALIHLASFNIIPLLWTTFVLFIFMNLLFWQATSNTFTLFEIQKIDFYDNSFLNHVVNVTTYIADLEDKMQVKPRGIFGVLVLILIKVLVLILLGNFILERIKDSINTEN